MSKLYLLDVYSLAFRAFYAIDVALATKDGRPTNALYGFALMLNKLIEQHQPEYIVAAFDRGRPTIRLEKYPEYKAQRDKTPQELREQIDYIRRLIASFGISIFEVDGHEADDVIGTLCLHAESIGMESVIVTSDRDSLQLVSPRTSVMLTRRGVTDAEIVGEAAVKERYGLKPVQLIDLKALMGDPSDNIKGVKGVGEKTALTLLKEYGTVEEIYNNIDDISRERLRKLLEEGRESAFLSKFLATIVRNVDLGFELSTFKKLEVNKTELADLYRELELNTLLERLGVEEDAGFSAVELEAVELSSVDKSTLKSFDQGQDIGIVVSGETELVITVSDGEKVYELSADQLKEVCSGDCTMVVCGYKDVATLLRAYDLSLEGTVCDVKLAGYLLEPSSSSYDIKLLIAKYLSVTINDDAGSALYLPKLWKIMKEELQDKGLWRLYEDVELPLSRVLLAMEEVGFSLDADILKSMEEDVDTRLDSLIQDIYTLAGEEFNISSPKQLSVVLFEKLGLPVIKKTKTGYSTDAEVLETLAEQHDVVRLILLYRTLTKLKSTYLQGLQKVIGPDSKVHTTYNQTVTVTGRLSSTEPNLQNIPVRLPEGRLIRRAFKPTPPFSCILAADYSQIELRILAHLSEDPILSEAFTKGEDIHSRTAAEVFGAPLGEVTREMRDRAKAVNFGIVYGISDYGLARDIRVPRGEAREYIANYFARYEGVKKYIDGIIAEAREKGYVTTMLNRRRYLPDINHRNFSLRSFAERTAMNTPIQGTAADLIKLAMVRIAEKLQESGLKSRMILQVHDELLFETCDEELEVLKELVKDTMEKALSLTVPLVVDLKVGDNWYNVKPI